MIRAVDVSRGFPVGDSVFWGLKHINMEIPAGKLTILKGRSGSGKTTLLNILSALDRPTEGEVYIDGVDVTKRTDRERDLLRRTKVGYVYQSVALIPRMTAYENVEFALRLAAKTKEGRERLIEYAEDITASGRYIKSHSAGLGAEA